MSSRAIRVVLLCHDCTSTRVIFHFLEQHGFDVSAIVEESESPALFFRRRARRLGWLRTGGQIAYIVLAKVQRKFYSHKSRRLIEEKGFSTSALDAKRVTKVTGANSAESITAIKNAEPDVVVVNGTRILSKKLIESVDVPIINTHLGITPQYRGVYGGYWARVKGDEANIGATIHSIDPGIDTGSVLHQSRVSQPCKLHSCLLPHEQLACVLPAMPNIIRELVDNHAQSHAVQGESRLWYHPTLWEYLWNGFFRRVW